MAEKPTLFEAMQKFESLTRAVAFTANEVALFHVLLYSWNVAHRPAVLEEWADTICRRSGLSKHSLPTARNKLIQKGVISYEKTGRKSPPRYSLFPPLLPISGNKGGNESGIKAGMKADLSQGKEQEEEQDKSGGAGVPPSPPDRPSGIPTLEEARRFVLSDPSMIPPDCVEAWMDDRSSTGWEKAKGQALVPIRDWRADLRGYGRNWRENRANRPEAPKPPPKSEEGPEGWQEAFRQIIPHGPIPIQWNHVDPELRAEIKTYLAMVS